jgi:hypothetical protein
MGKKAEHERYAIVSGAGTAQQAIEIRQVVDVNGGRRAFAGSVLQPGDPVHDLYIEKPPPTATSRIRSPTSNRPWATGSAPATAAHPSTAATSSPATTSGPSTSASPRSAR